jgi:hypothetical protein
VGVPPATSLHPLVFDCCLSLFLYTTWIPRDDNDHVDAAALDRPQALGWRICFLLTDQVGEGWKGTEIRESVRSSVVGSEMRGFASIWRVGCRKERCLGSLKALGRIRLMRMEGGRFSKCLRERYGFSLERQVHPCSFFSSCSQTRCYDVERGDRFWEGRVG